MMDTNIELIRLALKLVIDSSVSAKMAEVAKKAFAELDVSTAAQKAVVSGAGAIAQGEAVAAGEGSVAVGGDVSDKYKIEIGGAQGVAIGDNAQVGNIVQTKGGAFVSGRVEVQGDYIGRDKIIGGSVKDSSVEQRQREEQERQRQEVEDRERRQREEQARQTANQENIAGRDLVIHNVTIPYDTAFDRIAHSTTSVLHQLEGIYTQTREQAQVWFRFSLIAAGVGFILIGIGVVAVVFGQLTAGLITSLSSAIPNVVAALFFLQSKAANERVDAIQTKLTEAREVQTAVEIANTISDRKSRDRLKIEIVRKTLLVKDKE